jgi:hypothetical protein
VPAIALSKLLLPTPLGPIKVQTAPDGTDHDNAFSRGLFTVPSRSTLTCNPTLTVDLS